MPPKKKLKGDNKEIVTLTGDDEQEIISKRGQKTPKITEKNEAASSHGTKINAKQAPVKVLQNKTSTEFDSQDFTNGSRTDDGKPWTLKIATWNVDGIRAWVKKGGLEYLRHENPDILCLQETKCSDSKLPKEVQIKGYHTYWCHSENEGYAGVGLYTKVKPISVSYGIGLEEFDKEGRLIVAEYEAYYIINVYVPNAGKKLVSLSKRMEWDPEFRKLVDELDTKKPVIICGDMNVCHQEIDIANPKGNKRNAGFTQEERDGFTALLSSDRLTDCFRYKNPDSKGAYTFWTYLANARKKNIGWRLDYCLLSEKLSSSLCDCVIRSEVFGSDHCPVVLLLHV